MQLKGMKIIVRRARRLRRTTHEVPRVGVREPRPSRRKSANSQYHGITSRRQFAQRWSLSQRFEVREGNLVPGYTSVEEDSATGPAGIRTSRQQATSRKPPAASHQLPTTPPIFATLFCRLVI